MVQGVGYHVRYGTEGGVSPATVGDVFGGGVCHVCHWARVVGAIMRLMGWGLWV